jgi:hypothetical protein
MRLAAAAFLLLVFVVPAGARARTEPAPELVEHARVRVTLIERERVVGTLLEIRPDALRLETDSLVQSIPRAEIRKVEMSRGMVSSSGKGFHIGAIVGGLAGVVFGVLLAGIAESETGESQYVEAGVALGLFGAVTGGGLGALIGSSFENESWKEAKP